MKRRQFVAGAAAGAAATAAGTLPAPALAQSGTAWKMVTPWPKNAPGVGVNAQRVADRITEMSDGRLTVTLYAAGELVPPFEALDAVQSGSADLMHATPYYWVGKSQALNYFTGVPFGLNAVELASWIADLTESEQAELVALYWIGRGDGETRSFQLSKTYRSGGESYVRPIAKPVDGSVHVGVDGEELSIDAWRLDAASGRVTLDVEDAERAPWMLQPHEGPSETGSHSGSSAAGPRFNPTRVRLKLVRGAGGVNEQQLQPHEGPSET